MLALAFKISHFNEQKRRMNIALVKSNLPPFLEYKLNFLLPIWVLAFFKYRNELWINSFQNGLDHFNQFEGKTNVS